MIFHDCKMKLISLQLIYTVEKILRKKILKNISALAKSSMYLNCRKQLQREIYRKPSASFNILKRILKPHLFNLYFPHCMHTLVKCILFLEWTTEVNKLCSMCFIEILLL